MKYFSQTYLKEKPPVSATIAPSCGFSETSALWAAGTWLRRHGDPYALSVLDLDGRVGIDYGVYGVPETYLIDKAGIIRLKQTGPITPDVFASKILPLLVELSK